MTGRATEHRPCAHAECEAESTHYFLRQGQGDERPHEVRLCRDHFFAVFRDYEFGEIRVEAR